MVDILFSALECKGWLISEPLYCCSLVGGLSCWASGDWDNVRWWSGSMGADNFSGVSSEAMHREAMAFVHVWMHSSCLLSLSDVSVLSSLDFWGWGDGALGDTALSWGALVLAPLPWGRWKDTSLVVDSSDVLFWRGRRVGWAWPVTEVGTEWTIWMPPMGIMENGVRICCWEWRGRWLNNPWLMLGTSVLRALWSWKSKDVIRLHRHWKYIQYVHQWRWLK